MTDILHRVVIETSPKELYEALTDDAELSAWWTKAETLEAGDSTRFSFGPNGDHQVLMKLSERVANERVVWQCVEGAWVQTTDFRFEIRPDERGSVLLFAHRGWAEADEFFMHCNCKWGFFLGVSLKSYPETGTGKPHPLEPKI